MTPKRIQWDSKIEFIENLHVFAQTWYNFCCYGDPSWFLMLEELQTVFFSLTKDLFLHSACTFGKLACFIPMSSHFHQNKYTSLHLGHACCTCAGCHCFALHRRIQPWINNNSAEIILERFLPPLLCVGDFLLSQCVKLEAGVALRVKVAQPWSSLSDWSAASLPGMKTHDCWT